MLFSTSNIIRRIIDTNIIFISFYYNLYLEVKAIKSLGSNHEDKPKKISWMDKNSPVIYNIT